MRCTYIRIYENHRNYYIISFPLILDIFSHIFINILEQNVHFVLLILVTNLSIISFPFFNFIKTVMLARSYITIQFVSVLILNLLTIYRTLTTCFCCIKMTSTTIKVCTDVLNEKHILGSSLSSQKPSKDCRIVFVEKDLPIQSTGLRQVLSIELNIVNSKFAFS